MRGTIPFGTAKPCTRVSIPDFDTLLAAATEVRSDRSGQYFLIRLPGEEPRFYQLGIEAAFLLAEGEQAQAWAREVLGAALA